jgi:hypothetical protein
MSRRRTKLILLFVLVATVCLVAVELVLSWSPENPLRFRLSAPRTAPAADQGIIDYPVTVENTTSTTIHLIKADLFAPVKDEDEDEGEGADQHAHVYLSSALIPFSAAASTPLTVIPPHSTCEVVLPLAKEFPFKDLKGAHINYFCASRSKAAIYRAVVRLEKALPFLKLDPLFPYLASDTHRTPLEFQ